MKESLTEESAQAVHRFEEFSEDFATWVFFYGPEGGEGVLPDFIRSSAFAFCRNYLDIIPSETFPLYNNHVPAHGTGI